MSIFRKAPCPMTILSLIVYPAKPKCIVWLKDSSINEELKGFSCDAYRRKKDYNSFKRYIEASVELILPTERQSKKPFEKVSTGQQPSIMLKSLLRNVYNAIFITGKYTNRLKHCKLYLFLGLLQPEVSIS